MSGIEVNEKSVDEFCLPIKGLIRAANKLLESDSNSIYEAGYTFLRRCANCEAGVDLQVVEDDDHKLRVGKVSLHGHCREETSE